MSTPLYQKCERCHGSGRTPDPDDDGGKPRPCFYCTGTGYWLIGLSLAQVDRYVHEAHHFYHADGTAERLNSADEVKARRIAAAGEIERLRARVEELETNAS